jgi:integrase
VSGEPPPRPETPRGVEPRLRQGPCGPVWRFRVRWRDPRTGKRLAEELDTIADALDFQAHLRLARRRGVLSELDRGTQPLSAFVERWWSQWAAHNLARPTLKVYASLWNLHGLPRVGHVALRDVTPAVVDELRAALERDGVGPAAIRKLLTMLQAVFRQAVTWGEVPANPLREVRKPPGRRRLVVTALAPEAVEALRAELPEPGRTLVGLLAYEGLRPEEALALSDEHVRPGTLLIASKNVDGQIQEGSKTGRRLRTPTLFGPVRTDLAAYRLAAPPTGSALLFARADGAPWRETDYRNWRRRHFKPAAERLGLPITHPYDLRHTCASLLLHAGWPLTEVAEHLGHSVAVLSDTYAHVIAELRGTRPVPVETAIDRARRRPASTKRPQNAPSRPSKRASRKARSTKKAPISGAFPESPLPDSNRRPLPYH